MQQSFSTSSFDEKPSVQSLLGPRKESLSTAEVQLKILTSLQPLKWKVKATGVACFVKDFNRKGYYIEVNLKQSVINNYIPRNFQNLKLVFNDHKLIDTNLGFRHECSEECIRTRIAE